MFATVQCFKDPSLLCFFSCYFYLPRREDQRSKVTNGKIESEREVNIAHGDAVFSRGFKRATLFNSCLSNQMSVISECFFFLSLYRAAKRRSEFLKCQFLKDRILMLLLLLLLDIYMYILLDQFAKEREPETRVHS